MTEGNDQTPMLEVISEVRSKWTKPLESLRTFWRTKRAVETGAPLYDWSTTEINKAGYYSPGKFIVVATVITGGVGSGTANLINLLAGTKPVELTVYPEVFPTFLSVMYAIGPNTVGSWVIPFFIPIFFIAFSFFIAWGSLLSKDSNPQAHRRARSAYLYFNSAHGFFLQLIMAFGQALLSTKFGQDLIASEPLHPLTTIFLLALVIVSFRQSWVSGGKIPRLLFVANGYTTRVRRFWQRSQPNDPPWNRLWHISVPGLMFLLIVFSFLWMGISFSLAWLLVNFRALIL